LAAWFKEPIKIIKLWQFPINIIASSLCYLVFCIVPHALSVVHLFLMLTKAG